MGRRAHYHNHKCQRCHLKYLCDGELEENYDGWPEVICYTYHVAGRDWCAACVEEDQQATVTEEDDHV